MLKTKIIIDVYVVLSRLLLNNNNALLYSIRVVTQLNSGKRTAGVDSEIVLTDA